MANSTNGECCGPRPDTAHSNHMATQASRRPLLFASYQIRLLTIAPSIERDSILACSLSIVSLDEDPDFEALSYTWGDETITVPILLEGEVWQVTTNLNDALNHFRHKQLPRTMFVDALCINQHDLEEKSQQVPLMGRVYTQASTVHCWIGKSTEHVDRALEILKQAGNGIMMKDMIIHGRPIEAEDLRLMTALFNRPYWKRAWIIQEVVLPMEAIFHCGDHQFQRRDIPEATQLVISIASAFDQFRTTDENALLFTDAINSMAQNILGFLDALAALRDGTIRKLPALRFMAIARQAAAVLHDHVYAFLGIMDPKLSRQVTPDYRESVSAVFSKFAYEWMRFKGKATLLPIAVGLYEHNLKLPSWSPDFSNDSGIAPVSSRFDENEQITADFQLSNEAESLLGINAFHLDRVVAVQAVAAQGIGMSSLDEHPDLALQLHQAWRKFFGLCNFDDEQGYVGGGSLEDAYWRLMCLEQTALVQDLNKWIEMAGVDAMRHWLRQHNQCANGVNSTDMSENVRKYNSRLSIFASYHIFKTAKGYIGMTDRRTAPEQGDAVFLIATTAAPFLLRQAEPTHEGAPTYRLVSQAYVAGCMLKAVLPGEATPELPEINYKDYVHPHMKIATSWEKVWLR